MCKTIVLLGGADHVYGSGAYGKRSAKKSGRYDF